MTSLEAAVQHQRPESILVPLHAVTAASLLRTVIVGTAGADRFNNQQFYAINTAGGLIKEGVMVAGCTSADELMATAAEMSA